MGLPHVFATPEERSSICPVFVMQKVSCNRSEFRLTVYSQAKRLPHDPRFSVFAHPGTDHKERSLQPQAGDWNSSLQAAYMLPRAIASAASRNCQLLYVVRMLCADRIA